MTFVLVMAAREMRASWRRLVFFFLCIAIGVGAIVTLRSVIQSVRQVFAGEARALIAADLVVSSSRPIDGPIAAAIEARLSAAGAAVTRTAETATMARSAATADAPARMVELKAVDRGSRTTAPCACRAAPPTRTVWSPVSVRWCARSCWRSSASPWATGSRWGGASSPCAG